ncbi:MAG: RNA polymerase sigma-70 factor [Pedobacter sp.]|nr:MAG: RNA polymerase sigma-70 factor [Pedobacter sp.]
MHNISYSTIIYLTLELYQYILPLKIVHNDRSLLQDLKSGSKEAFEQLYHIYSKQIFHNILRMVRSSENAQEILQIVFIKVWEQRESINPELSFKAFLYKISNNHIFNYFRSAGIERRIKAYLQSTNTELYSHIEENIHIAQQKELLHLVIEKLPPQRRVIYKLCKLEGKSYDEVSQELNISTGTISDHIVKANRFIRDQFLLRKAFGSITIATLLFENL